MVLLVASKCKINALNLQLANRLCWRFFCLKQKASPTPKKGKGMPSNQAKHVDILAYCGNYYQIPPRSLKP